jgi:hypothetical protein
MILSNYSIYLIIIASIILIFGIFNIIIIQKALKSIRLISLKESDMRNELITDLVRIIIKLRFNLNKSVSNSEKGELQTIVKKKVYNLDKFQTFLSSLKYLGYELSTDLYYGDQYLLTIKWDKSRYVQKTQ